MSDHSLYLIEFLPGIWISNRKTLNENLAKQKKLNTMLDCTKEMNFFDGAENFIQSIKHQIKKEQHHKLHQYLLKITEQVHTIINKGNSLLIYDPQAIKKAPIIIIAYLLRYGKMRPEQTIQSFMSKSKIPIKLEEDYQIGLKLFFKHIESSNSSISLTNSSNSNI
jgi:hypothetical protein